MTFNRLAVTLLFTVIAAAACLMPAQNDTFWHLRAGLEAWRNGIPQYRDTFSHTAFGGYWPNHEWLTQAVFYGAYLAAGLPGVTLICVSMVAAGWAMSWRLMSGTTSLRVCLVGAVIPTSATLWSLRPQAISLGFVGVCAWLIATRRARWVPFVCVLWANFHGAALMAIVLTCGALAAALVYDRREARRLLIVLAVSAIAMCATPLGLSWWPEMVVSLARIRIVAISEWQPASIVQLVDAPFWALAASIIVLGFRRRRAMSADDAILTGMALALLPLAVMAGRNVPPFLLIAVPALTRLLPDRVRNWQCGLASRPGRTAHTWAASGALASAAAVVLLAWSGPAERLGWRPLPDSVVAAVEACPANLYNRYDDGGFFIWFTPGQRVFLDGRQDPFPVQLILDHRATESAGRYRDVFERFGIRCAALPGSSPTAARLLHAGWQRTADAGGWVVLQQQQ